MIQFMDELVDLASEKNNDKNMEEYTDEQTTY